MNGSVTALAPRRSSENVTPEPNAPVLHHDAVVLMGTTASDFRDSAQAILGTSAAAIEVTHFRDGETGIKVPANVRDKDVYLVHRLGPPANESLMELCLTLDALTKASARRITVILPYMAYARSDRRMEGREPIAAQLVARFIETSGAHRAIILDLHSEQAQGFFRIPVDNIYGTNVLIPEVTRSLREQGINPADIVVVSPDAGGAKRARAVAKSLGARFALIDKMRPRANEVEGMVLLGDVSNSVCLLIDDMVDTAGTLVAGAELLKTNRATKVIAACTHPLLSGDAQERIEASCISEFHVTDSVRIPEVRTKKLKVAHLGGFLGELIRRVNLGESLLNLRQQRNALAAA